MFKYFDTKDAVPDAQRESAVETKEGKWAVVDNDAFHASKERILDEKKKLQAKYEELERSLGGISSEQIQKYRSDMARLEEEQARKAGDFDKLLEKRIGETKAEYEKRLAEAEQYKTKYVDREVEFAIRDAAAKAGVPPEDIPYVVDLHKGRRVRYDEKTGKAIVYDRDGDPTGLSVEKFYAESFKAEAPKFYASTSGSGGGSTGGGTRAPGGAPAITDQASFLANLDKIAKAEVKVATT
ncbi:MAG: hypothetical protein ACK5QX_04380 [bacterium]|jgi:hypothetical protein